MKKIPQGRALSVRLKKARGRKVSSQRWLTRQLNDPYVRQAKESGLRSRAAFKLSQIDDKYKLLKPGATVVDLGAAPGGWTQVCVDRVGSKGIVIGLDLSPMDPIAGVTLICGDFNDSVIIDELKSSLPGPVDVVLSDMAASSTGHTQTDHLRIMALAEEAFEFAIEVLREGGAFVAKVLRGGTEKELLMKLKNHFEKVVHFKPAASRSDSSEIYVIGIGFRQ